MATEFEVKVKIGTEVDQADLARTFALIDQAFEKISGVDIFDEDSLRSIRVAEDAMADLQRNLAAAGADGAAAFDTVGASLKDVDKISRDVGGGFSKAFQFNQIVEGVSHVADALNAVVQPAVEFEASLAAVSAITGQSGEPLERLGDIALDMSTKFGGKATDQLASLQGVLSKMGAEVADTPEALGQIVENINTLSAASGDDAATSMNAIVDSMLQFGLVSGDAAKDAATSTSVINALAASAQVGAAEIPQVAEAILQAGVAMKGANLSFEQGNAAIQALALGGKVGAEAGVSLRNVLGLMQSASGPAEAAMKRLGTSSAELGEILTTRGLDAALEELNKGFDGVGSAAQKNALLMEIFGTENSAAAGILLENVDKMKEFEEGIILGQQGMGAAFEQAATRMDTSSTAIAQVQATVESAFIGITSAAGPAFSTIISSVSSIGPTIAPLANIKQIIPEEAFSAIKVGAESAGKALISFATNPITLVLAGAAGLGFVLNELIDTQREELEATLEAGQAQQKAVEIQKSQIESKIKLAQVMPQLVSEYEELGKKTNRTADEQRRLTDITLKLNGTYPGLIKSGKSFEENLVAVKLQAAQTTGAIGTMTGQMLALDRQAQEIAARNRQIQAEILRDTINTNLFKAGSAAGGFFDEIINGTGRGTAAVVAFRDEFKNLFDAKTENAVIQRAGEVQLRLAQMVQQGVIKGPVQQEIAALVTQLEGLLVTKFKKTETAAVDTATAIGTVGVAADRATETIRRFEGGDESRARVRELELQRRLALIDDELLKNLAAKDGAIKAENETYEAKKKNIPKEFKDRRERAAAFAALEGEHTAQLALIETQRNQILVQAREKLGADILKTDSELLKTEAEAYKLQADQITETDSASLERRRSATLQQMRELTLAKVQELALGSAEFSEQVKTEAATEAQAYIDARLVLADAQLKNDAEATRSAQALFDAAKEGYNARVRTLRDEFIIAQVTAGTTLGKQIENAFAAGAAEEAKEFSTSQKAVDARLARERIAFIVDATEQEKQLRLLALQEQLDKDLELHEGNETKRLELRRAAARAAAQIEAEYLQQTQLVFQQSVSFMSDLLEGLASVGDPERDAALEKDLAAFDAREDALTESLLKQEIAITEFDSKMLALSEERAAKERELGRATGDFWTDGWNGIKEGAVVAFDGIAESQKAIIDRATKDLSFAEVSIGLAASIGAAGVAAAAANEDALHAMVSSAFDALQAMVPIFSSMILGYSLATPDGVLTLGATAFAKWAALTAVLATAVAGARAGLGFMDGGYTGDVPVDQPVGPAHGQEFVHTAAVTRIPENRELFEHLHAGGSQRDWFADYGADLGFVTIADLDSFYININGQLQAGFDAMAALQRQVDVSDELERGNRMSVFITDSQAFTQQSAQHALAVDDYVVELRANKEAVERGAVGTIEAVREVKEELAEMRALFSRFWSQHDMERFADGHDADELFGRPESRNENFLSLMREMRDALKRRR